MFERTEDAITRGHNYKLFQKHSKLEICLNSFLFHVLPIWNALQPEVVKSNSINIFK